MFLKDYLIDRIISHAVGKGAGRVGGIMLQKVLNAFVGKDTSKRKKITVWSTAIGSVITAITATFFPEHLGEVVAILATIME